MQVIFTSGVLGKLELILENSTVALESNRSRLESLFCQLGKLYFYASFLTSFFRRIPFSFPIFFLKKKYLSYLFLFKI